MDKGLMVPEEVALEVAVVEGGWIAKGVAVRVQEARQESLRRRVFSATATSEIGGQLSGSVQCLAIARFKGNVKLSFTRGGHSSRGGRSPGRSA